MNFAKLSPRSYHESLSFSLREKTLTEDVYTPMDKLFAIEVNSVLDERLRAEIDKSCAFLFSASSMLTYEAQGSLANPSIPTKQRYLFARIVMELYFNYRVMFL